MFARFVFYFLFKQTLQHNICLDDRDMYYKADASAYYSASDFIDDRLVV